MSDMQRISQTELAKITYLDLSAIDERVVLLMPLWDGDGWHMWINIDENTLIEMKPIDTAHSHYVAKAPAKETDVFFWFADFMFQRAHWAETSRHVRAICDDFHMLGTSAAKLRHFYETRDQVDNSLLASFVRTELEYMLTVSRSVFDLLQEAVAEIWNRRMRFPNDPDDAKRPKLPDTFSKVVLHEKEQIRTAEQIAQRFRLPEVLAARYAADAATFAHLRKWRDRIIHGGSSVDMVFVTEKGFCVSSTHPAFSDFAWTDDHRYNEAIVSLLPWVANIIGRTVDACTGLMSTLASLAAFPAEVAPGYRIYLRDPANFELAAIQRVLDGELVWWAEALADPADEKPAA